MPKFNKDAQHIDTPVTLYNQEIVEDELNDLELWKDELPQPYRRVDKILNEILDSAWEIIENRETQNLAEKNKVRPLGYENLFQLENLDGVNCICSSTDDEESFVFVGLKTAIVVVDASTLNIIDQVQVTQHQIKSITCSTISNQSSFLIVAKTDEDGLVMHLFAHDKLIAIPTPIDNDVDKRFKKIEISANTDYLAFLVESCTNSNVNSACVEVYKFHKEQWLNQIEALGEKLSNHNKIITSSENPLQDDLSLSQQQQIQEIAIKFQLFCRIKPHLLNSKVNPNNIVNLQAIQKATEHSDVIGLGVNHFFTKAHLDLKQQLIEKTYDVQLGEAANYDQKDLNFKFMPSNRLTSMTHENLNHNIDLPSSLMLWSKHSNQLCFYSFSKITKDLESKLEYCIPFTSEISSVEVTHLAPLIAVYLKNNSVIVFDTNAGLMRKNVHLNVNSLITLHFIPNNRNAQNSYSHLKVQIVCLSDDGRVFTIDCSTLSDSRENEVYRPKYMNNDDKFIFISPCLSLPNIILVVGLTGKKYLLDVMNGTLVCELTNPEGAEDIFHKDLIFANKNKFLFMKCIFEQNGHAKLFAHSLRPIPKLNDYFLMHENDGTQEANDTIMERTRYALKQQFKEQFARKERLNAFWNNLKDQKN